MSGVRPAGLTAADWDAAVIEGRIHAHTLRGAIAVAFATAAYSMDMTNPERSTALNEGRDDLAVLLGGDWTRDRVSETARGNRDITVRELSELSGSNTVVAQRFWLTLNGLNFGVCIGAQHVGRIRRTTVVGAPDVTVVRRARDATAHINQEVSRMPYRDGDVTFGDHLLSLLDRHIAAHDSRHRTSQAAPWRRISREVKRAMKLTPESTPRATLYHAAPDAIAYVLRQAATEGKGLTSAQIGRRAQAVLAEHFPDAPELTPGQKASVLHRMKTRMVSQSPSPEVRYDAATKTYRATEHLRRVSLPTRVAGENA